MVVNFQGLIKYFPAVFSCDWKTKDNRNYVNEVKKKTTYKLPMAITWNT